MLINILEKKFKFMKKARDHEVYNYRYLPRVIRIGEG